MARPSPSAASASRNPFGFTPLPVTLVTVAVYVALLAALLVTHHVVPAAPSDPTPQAWPGVNVSRAWADLQELSKDHHPYTARSNDAVRSWLLTRIADILDGNHVGWKTVSERASKAHTSSPLLSSSSLVAGDAGGAPAAVTVFDDMKSNITTSAALSFYFEGTNIMVYIRGSEDTAGDWWTNSKRAYDGPGGVLVNAHYDSVSTGFGATDDGVGVVTILQLISHFTTEGNTPRRGILCLLNNAEEDGLYGAKAFTKHPMARFAHTFLNLEGAGAGGRATLFRSTDAEVTSFYKTSKYPFGSVISGDGFRRGLVKSGTDYSVFVDSLAMRGLDVAFMEPRARYHTAQDDARDTSIDSVWHMLSAALSTVKGLSDYSGTQFDQKDERGTAHAGIGSIGVWFDLFGRAFAVMQLHTLFAISVTLLVAGPVILILLEISLRGLDRWYLFSRKGYLHSSDDDESIKLYGWRGFFRFPLAFIVATGIAIVLAYLLTKFNPLIVYSSEYAVWSMMLTAWLSFAWFLVRLGDSVRPSALSRAYTLLWIYALSWVSLVLVTVGENNLHLGSGYFVVIYNAGIYAALLISYLELFALPKKSVYIEHVAYNSPGNDESPTRSASIVSAITNRPDTRRGREALPASANDNDDDANERTSLLSHRQTFTRYGGHHRSEQLEDVPPMGQDPMLGGEYEGEQAWSSNMPRWTWLLQYLVLAPMNVILVGQIALLMTSALHQTPADGSPILTIYMLMAALSALLLLPTAPFLHRMTYHVPTFLFMVFIGTLIYNLVAFPFSHEHQLKVFFTQRVDCDTGENQVALTGLEPFVQHIVGQLPSAAGQEVQCGHVDWANRPDLSSCVWTGLHPHVVPHSYSRRRGEAPYPNSTVLARRSAEQTSTSAATAADVASWLTFNITRPQNSSEYVFDIRGANTRACRLYLDSRIVGFAVENSVDGFSAKHTTNTPLVPDYRSRSNKMHGVADASSGADKTQIRLWSREWDSTFRVRVSFPRNQDARTRVAEDEQLEQEEDMLEVTKKKHRHDRDGGGGNAAGVQGMVTCLWNDVNAVGTIPAFDEVLHFEPVWSAVTKGADGLVEGFKRFTL